LHRWCNGEHAHLDCSRSWIWILVESNVSTCCFPSRHGVLRSKDLLAREGVR
jgi:hypothetical protein